MQHPTQRPGRARRAARFGIRLGVAGLFAYADTLVID